MNSDLMSLTSHEEEETIDLEGSITFLFLYDWLYSFLARVLGSRKECVCRRPPVERKRSRALDHVSLSHRWLQE